MTLSKIQPVKAVMATLDDWQTFQESATLTCQTKRQFFLQEAIQMETTAKILATSADILDLVAELQQAAQKIPNTIGKPSALMEIGSSIIYSAAELIEAANHLYLITTPETD